MYAQDSIALLRHSGIDFSAHAARGIDTRRFGELLLVSGVVLVPDVRWITFHSGCVRALGVGRAEAAAVRPQVECADKALSHARCAQVRFWLPAEAGHVPAAARHGGGVLRGALADRALGCLSL